MDNQTNTTETMVTADSELMDFIEVLQGVQTGLSPTLLILGLICNLLTILTMSDPLFKRMNTQIMLITLAVTDTLMLFVGFFNQKVSRDFFGRDVRALSRVGCKTFMAVYRSGKVCSSWIVVFVAVERFIAVVFPLRVKSLVNRKTTVITLLCMFLGVIGFNAAWSFSSEILRNTCVASLHRPEMEKMHKVFNILRGIQYSFLPIIILLAVTPPIIFKLIESHRRRANMVANAASGTTKDLTRTTLMLIMVVLLHIISSVPLTLYFIQEVVYDESVYKVARTEYVMVYKLQPTLEAINHASNFLIYIVFSRQFRKRLVKKLQCSCLLYFVHLKLIERRREMTESTINPSVQ